MPRRKKPQANKRGWRWYANTGLNVIVALSMILGTVLLFTGGSITQRSSVTFPTDFPAVDIPTLAPTVGAPLTTAVPPSPPPVQTPAATPTVKP